MATPFTSESLIGDELDRLIHSAVLRIEQQGFHVAQSSGSRTQAAVAQRVLDGMIQGLRQLKSRRAQFP
jgi:hypothetical protein